MQCERWWIWVSLRTTVCMYTHERTDDARRPSKDRGRLSRLCRQVCPVPDLHPITRVRRRRLLSLWVLALGLGRLGGVVGRVGVPVVLGGLLAAAGTPVAGSATIALVAAVACTAMPSASVG